MQRILEKHLSSLKYVPFMKFTCSSKAFTCFQMKESSATTMIHVCQQCANIIWSLQHELCLQRIITISTCPHKTHAERHKLISDSQWHLYVLNERIFHISFHFQSVFVSISAVQIQLDPTFNVQFTHLSLNTVHLDR